jgi:hypothetical protein
MSAPGGSEIDDSAGDSGQEEEGFTEAPPGRQWRLHREVLAESSCSSGWQGQDGQAGEGRGVSATIQRWNLRTGRPYG